MKETNKILNSIWIYLVVMLIVLGIHIRIIKNEIEKTNELLKQQIELMQPVEKN